MSDERREPTRHHILAAAGITVGAPAVEMAVLKVVRPEELAPALAQRELPVVIENDELQRRFERSSVGSNGPLGRSFRLCLHW